MGFAQRNYASRGGHDQHAHELLLLRTMRLAPFACIAQLYRHCCPSYLSPINRPKDHGHAYLLRDDKSTYQQVEFKLIRIRSQPADPKRQRHVPVQRGYGSGLSTYRKLHSNATPAEIKDYRVARKQPRSVLKRPHNQQVQQYDAAEPACEIAETNKSRMNSWHAVDSSTHLGSRT